MHTLTDLIRLLTKKRDDLSAAIALLTSAASLDAPPTATTAARKAPTKASKHRASWTPERRARMSQLQRERHAKLHASTNGAEAPSAAPIQ